MRAQAGPSNPIGIHAQVWVGDWSKDEAVTAISGTKKAGYDLIECESIFGMHIVSRRVNALFHINKTKWPRTFKCHHYIISLTIFSDALDRVYFGKLLASASCCVEGWSRYIYSSLIGTTLEFQCPEEVFTSIGTHR